MNIRYTYRIREDWITDEDGVLHQVYGIEVVEMPTGRLLEQYTVADLFTNRERAEALAELCTRLELSPIHLMDVAEDALAEGIPL